MAWLWLISVGVTDVQFPVWTKDDFGAWTERRRFDPGRRNIRKTHETLLMLLELNRLAFPDDLPPEAEREWGELKLALEGDGSDFLASVVHERSPSDYSISEFANYIPNANEQALPLYFPKATKLLEIAQTQFAAEPVSVVVLNTRRDASFIEAPHEPVASGPLVAKFLSEKLKIKWVAAHGNVPRVIEPGASTWVDFLLGNEALEEAKAQQKVVARVFNIIKSWPPARLGEGRIAITTAGGMGPLKPIIERVPATCVGQERVIWLDAPERRGPAEATPLNFHARVIERETLRFYCAEALRNRDYVGAYGLASRYADAPWAKAIRNTLGPFLQLPHGGAAPRVKGRRIAPHELEACRVEACLCGRDAAGAAVQLFVFFEAAMWDLIEGNKELESLGLSVDREDEYLRGHLRGGEGLDDLIKTKRPGLHRVEGLTFDDGWIAWLASKAGHDQLGHTCSDECVAIRKLQGLLRRYNGGSNPSLRKCRNKLVHGAGEIEATTIQNCFSTSGLAAQFGGDFGYSFLGVKSVQAFLATRGAPSLVSDVRAQLGALLSKVVEA